jgi:hypothetical protein
LPEALGLGTKGVFGAKLFTWGLKPLDFNSSPNLTVLGKSLAGSSSLKVKSQLKPFISVTETVALAGDSVELVIWLIKLVTCRGIFYEMF